MAGKTPIPALPQNLGGAPALPLVTALNDRIRRINLALDAITALDLETNGRENGDQALLNLVAGANVTISDGGSGAVTVAATAGVPAVVTLFKTNEQVTLPSLAMADVAGMTFTAGPDDGIYPFECLLTFYLLQATGVKVGFGGTGASVTTYTASVYRGATGSSGGLWSGGVLIDEAFFYGRFPYSSTPGLSYSSIAAGSFVTVRLEGQVSVSNGTTFTVQIGETTAPTTLGSDTSLFCACLRMYQGTGSY